jgi:hypothetical protein
MLSSRSLELLLHVHYLLLSSFADLNFCFCFLIDILPSLQFLGDLLHENHWKIFVSFRLISLTFYLFYNFFKPFAIRAKGMSLYIARNWLWNFSIGYATPHLNNPYTTGLNRNKAANLGVKMFTPQMPFVRPFLLHHCNK